MMPSIMSGSLIRETPPWALMSAGTRSSAITATAPASSAIFAWSAVTTSMITPPLSISAIPRLTRAVPVAEGVDEVASESVPGTAGVDTEDLTGETGTVPTMVGPRPTTTAPVSERGRQTGSAGDDVAGAVEQRDPDLAGREGGRLATDR